MRRFLACSVLALLVFSGTGCIVTSVYPFYSDDALVFDPTLLGKWLENDGATSYIFEKQGSDAYRVQLAERKTNDETETTTLVVRLFRLGEARFLDAYPEKVPDLGIGGHFLAMVERRGDRMTLRPLDVEAFDKVRGGTLLHVHRADDGSVAEKAGGPGFGGTLLMSPTAQLQAFIKEHAGEIFEKDGATMRKVGN